MAAPDQLRPHFLCNPWMSWQDGFDPRLARRQWERLVHLIRDAGGEVALLPQAPGEGSGAMCFTADGALVYAAGQALVLRNDGPRGALEPECFRVWLAAHGYTVEGLPDRLDGGNLVAAAPGVWLVGLKPGTTGRAERYLGRLLRRLTGARVLGVPLADPRYLHLDMAFASLGGRAYLYFPAAFPDGGRALLAQPWLQGRPALAVSAEDAACFACNTVLIGRTLITGPVSVALQRQLDRLGFAVRTADLGEFYKAGGGAKCLTLPLAPPTWSTKEEDPHAHPPGARRPAPAGG